LLAVCVAAEFLWTASDEGRTVECLEPYREGYRLRRQYRLDAAFPDLPGRETRDEADIESMEVDGGQLWLSGSHCRIRAESDAQGGVGIRIEPRRSHNLFGTIPLSQDGGMAMMPGQALPFAGRRSLRRRLG